MTQGMVRKLMPQPVTPGGPIVNSPMGFVDVPMTRTLLFDVYHPEAAAHDRPLGWFDPPSASILSLYEIVYSGFGQVLLQAGDSVHAHQGGVDRRRASASRSESSDAVLVRHAAAALVLSLAAFAPRRSSRA